MKALIFLVVFAVVFVGIIFATKLDASVPTVVAQQNFIQRFPVERKGLNYEIIVPAEPKYTPIRHRVVPECAPVYRYRPIRHFLGRIFHRRCRCVTTVEYAVQ
jgi:hypothetical protein